MKFWESENIYFKISCGFLGLQFVFAFLGLFVFQYPPFTWLCIMSGAVANAFFLGLAFERERALRELQRTQGWRRLATRGETREITVYLN